VPQLDLSSLIEGPNSSLQVTHLNSGPGTFWPLRQGLEEDEDFFYVAASGWEALTKAFSYPTDAPSLPRLCLAGERIEIAPNVYRLHMVVENPDIPVPPAAPVPPTLVTIPSTTKVTRIQQFVRSISKDLPIGTPLRLWSVDTQDVLPALQVAAKDMPELGAKLLRGEQTLADLGFSNGDSIVVETSKGSANAYLVSIDKDGKAIDKPAPLFSKPAYYSGDSSANNSSLALVRPETRSQSRGRGKGLVGLNNLGNTCFLASATQCLSNTHVLAEYFLSGVYRDELNPDNPLGMHGQVAEAFGEIVENLWTSPNHSSFSPRRLKATCSRFAPQFAGYGQHDTQEFLAFLLDGLHEDLNRIQKKPYIEKPDWKPGGGDRQLAELGKDCWEGYKKRNDSVIVDLFQGQLQSTLVCPECKKESITMDPFMYLTVPLPITQTRTFKCVYFPADTDKMPLNVQLLVPANASFSVVKDKLGALVKAPGANIVGFDYWKGGVYSWWMDSDPNSEAKDHDVCMFYELRSPVQATHRGVGVVATDDSVTVPVYTFTQYDHPRSSFQRDAVPSEGCMEPFFITLSRAEASDPAAVRMAIVKGYSRLVRPEKKLELFVPANTPQAIEVDDEPEVTEIHIEDVAAATASQDDDQLAPPTPIARVASNVSISSQNAPLVARAGLFKVHVADASSAETSNSMFNFKGKDPNLQTLYRGTPSHAASSWSSLDKRARIKRPIIQRIGSSISNLVSANGSDDDEPMEAVPVIRPGEGIFVEWAQDALDEFFEGHRERLLQNLEMAIDPAIVKDAEKKRAGRSISLDDCLDEFSKEETLGQDDLWYCPQCKKHQAATKKLDIYQAPDILVICLKRFGSSRTMRDKLDHMVNFPIDGLDLDERIGERRISKTLNLSDDEAKHYGIAHSTEPFIYDLYAVDNHFGGLGGGHYTAFCRNYVDDQWYNYDDSRVSKAGVDAVQSRAAYLLFYKRRTARAIGGISRIKAEEASRAATPMPSMPSSPMIAPSVPASAMASSMPSAPGTPLQPSPTLSSSTSFDSNSAEETFRIDDHVRGDVLPAYGDLATAGVSVGFGNTAWGSPKSDSNVVRHAFATSGQMPTPGSDSEADDEFVPVDVDVTTTTTATSVSAPSEAQLESGLGEEYATVRSDDTSDAEMVSVPRSPRSEEDM
jgi:ubiquitin carboxyl-terminal hydrolase 4/11/15